MATTTKKTKAPVKTSDRKRPSKSFITKMAEFRGFMTGNEKTQLATLDVKNVMQRVNNKTMSDDVNDNFNSAECKELMAIMKRFVLDIDNVIKNKK
jgi:hypothetical protein